MKSKILGASLLALSAAMGSSGAYAAAAAVTDTATADTGATLGELIVTGTRQAGGVKAADSAAPIQVVGASALKSVGQPDIMQALAQNLPSFNAQAIGGDTAQLTLSAALRGINPNDTLVLVNGKRRHSTANLAVLGGSPFSGSATTDLSLIPLGAIDHIEVLTDGAAAQYGTDAIAGVINIILKTSDHAGVMSATGGQYYEGDGTTGAFSFNKGFAIGGKGFVNATAEVRYHDFSQQGGADVRLYDPAGNLTATGIDAGAVNAPQAPRVNRINGDPNYTLYNLYYNAGYNITDAVQFYSTGSFSHRNASAFENYRVPSRVVGFEAGPGGPGTGAEVVPFPAGFQPREGIIENDYAISGGFKGTLAGWDWDASVSYGQDRDDVYTLDSANPGVYAATQSLSTTPIGAQRNFYDGTFTASQLTGNLDFVKSFEVGLASPLNVAFGAEARRDGYGILPGELNSYFLGGSQSFVGYTPLDATSKHRTNYAGYVDLAVNPIEHLHVDLAGRYESYSDFGSAAVGKFTGRYDFNPAFAIRGTISNGFRAPTLAEENYIGINVSPTQIAGQIPADSAAAAALGFNKLQPEKSMNYSVGFVAHPVSNLQITLDAYQISISGRILGSGQIVGKDPAGNGSPAVLAALAALDPGIDPTTPNLDVNLFANAADTRTRGIELTANYASDFGGWGHVDWSVGFNYNKTVVTGVRPLPTIITANQIGDVNQDLLTPTVLSSITTATPREKLILGAYWTYSRWSVNLRESIYGPSSLVVSENGTGAASDGPTNLRIKTTGITDLDIGFKVTDNLKLDVGANNLFNVKPPTVPFIPGYGLADGTLVYNEPDGFSPFGINGGYYYGRVTYSF